jgi:putative FmdB family regulatory protein
MPTYEYECEKCGLLFEEYQSISEQPLTKCKKPTCDGHVKRLISAGAGFLFKGNGFYGTDYRSDSYKKQAKADASSSGGKAGGASGDTKAPGSSTTVPASPATPVKS